MIEIEEKVHSILNSIDEFIHEHYQEYLQEAFEYFWEEERPEDILHGMMLEVGELNFEDWLIIDYRNPYGESFIDLYERYTELSEEELTILKALRSSTISLYEVQQQKGDKTILKDLLRDRTIEVRIPLMAGLRPGEIFATRLIEFKGEEIKGGEVVMGRCIYPFHPSLKDRALKYLDMQFKRYLKNENPGGNINTFLKDASTVFNTVWITLMAGETR